MSKSSNKGAKAHSSKTNNSFDSVNDLFGKLAQCNNLTIQNLETGHIEPISIIKTENQNSVKSVISDTFSEPPPQKKDIISVNLNSNLSSRLAFLLADVSLHPSKCKRPVTILHDSGCAHSILSYSVFKQFPDAHKKHLQIAPNLRVESFDGSQSPIVGIIELNIHFSGSNGVKATYSHPVIVHKNTTHDLMLGRDFTGFEKKLKVCETASHIYFRLDKSISRHVGIADGWETLINNTCAVPIFETGPGSIPIMSIREQVIPPGRTANVSCRLIDPHIDPEESEKPFEICSVALENASSPEALYFLRDYNKFTISITNNSELDDLFILPGVPIAQINFIDEDISLHNVCITSDSKRDVYFVNRVAFIESDDNLNEEEKLKAFDTFLAEGKFTPSMTSFVEAQPTISEFFPKNLDEVPFEQKFKLDHLAPADRDYALDEFRKIKDVFSKHDYDLGKAKDFEMDIEIDATKPRIQKYYPLPLKVRDEFKVALDQMLQYGIIRTCDEASLFCSNLLVTRRKNGQLRILLDGRLLNNATIRMPMCLVTNYETYAHLAQKPHVSVMDMSHSFFQIPLAEKAQPLTAFFSEAHGKRFCFTRAPQGLKNSPLYLKLFTDKVLGPLREYVIAYADDILIASDKSLRHHIRVVARVLRLLHESGIKMRPEKINLDTENIEFLGVIWNKGKLKIPEAKLQAFKNFPVPKTPKQVKSFIGALSFYRNFIPNFARLAKPLMDLATSCNNKTAKFHWQPFHQECFDKLIKSVINYANLYVPDPKKPFYVQTDASDFAAAGRVYQLDNQGRERLIACVSRTFTQVEQAYSTFRKEVLSLLYALKALDFFLRYAHRLVLLIDAKAILFLRMCKNSANILLRFSLELAKYEAEIHHVPGLENTISDVLSRQTCGAEEAILLSKSQNYLSEEDCIKILDRLRLPNGLKFTPQDVATLLEGDSLPAPVQTVPKSKAKKGKRIVTNMPKTLGEKKKNLPMTSSTRRIGVILPSNCSLLQCNSSLLNFQDLTALCQVATEGILSPKNLIEAQKADEDYAEIYRDLPKPFFLHNNILFFLAKDDYAKIVLPKCLITPLLNAKHYSIHGIHRAASRIRREILNLYHVNKDSLNEALSSIRTCITCQFNQNMPEKEKLRQYSDITAPRTIWAIDIIPSMPTSKHGNKCIFVAIDTFSNYVQVLPIKDRSTPELINALTTCIIRPFGLPKVIRCDNEAAIENSNDFLVFCKQFDIICSPISTAAPWSNGAAERAVQTIKKNLKLFVSLENKQNEWDDHIHLVALAHNSSMGTYGFSPEEIHFGEKLPNKSDLVGFFPTNLTPDQYMDHVVDKAIVARNKMRLEADKHNKRNLTYRNLHRADKTFKVGDVVLHSQKQVAVGPYKSIQPKYTGPYHIDSINTDEITAVLINMATRRSLIAHFSNIQKLFHDPHFNRLPENFDNAMLDLLPDKYSHSRYLAQLHADEERRQVSHPQSSDYPDDTQTQNVNFHTQTQQSTTQQQAEQDDTTADLDDPFSQMDPLNVSQDLTPGRYVTDTDTITVVRNDILDAVITQPHDPKKEMRVDIDTKPTCSRRVRTVEINDSKDPIEVRIITDPVEGMIEDTPRLLASQQDAKKQLKLSQAERAAARASRSNTQPTASQSSQTRYELRQRIHQTPNYTVWHILEPP